MLDCVLPEEYAAWTKLAVFVVDDNEFKCGTTFSGACVSFPAAYAAWTRMQTFSVRNNKLVGSLLS